MQFGGDRIRLLVRSRSGRWIYKWLKISGLANFRFKTVSGDSPLRVQVSEYVTDQFFTEDDLAGLAKRGAGQGVELR
jgi:hypothetical protein